MSRTYSSQNPGSAWARANAAVSSRKVSWSTSGMKAPPHGP